MQPGCPRSFVLEIAEEPQAAQVIGATHCKEIKERSEIFALVREPKTSFIDALDRPDGNDCSVGEKNLLV